MVLLAVLLTVVSLTSAQGNEQLVVTHLGFEQGINRAGQDCAVTARVTNAGGKNSPKGSAYLVLSSELRPVGPLIQDVQPLAPGATTTVRWRVTAKRHGRHSVMARAGDSKVCEATLHFAPAVLLKPSDYVPVPRPVKTDVDILARYCPQHPPIPDAPNRKSVLDYEAASPTSIDWQIKWAVENGIKGFIIDHSSQSKDAEKWLEAYQKARYRDLLSVALCWQSNGSAVSREWLADCFRLPGYYRLEGKPAIFVHSPEMAGAELAEITTAAREAGYEGVASVAVTDDFSETFVKYLRKQGYAAVTSGHEWGRLSPQSPPSAAVSFERLVKESPAAWNDKMSSAGELAYFPLVDTGWDPIPATGQTGFRFAGRSVDLFGELLDRAQAFAKKHDCPVVVLGPINGWAEGRYIEPCADYGFEMYEAIRNTFGRGYPLEWPVNVGPSDFEEDS